ncbi:GntR family transcriptional regulator [Rubrobacter marinus]|nr:GntR family transcriptional regulator [Rubrobacter marinus]
MRNDVADGGAGGRPRLGRLKLGSLADGAYEAVRGSIIRGEFGPGDRLVETRLAEEMGVSRAPVREALKRLVEEQLVVEKPRYGTFVREFTARDFADIYNLLGAIESLAARLIVRENASLEPLQALVGEMERAAREGDLVGVVDAEVRFHEELCAAAGNRYLSSVFHSLSGLVRMALSLDDATYGDLADVASEHLPLLEALGSGVEDRAVFAVQSHLHGIVGGEGITRLGGDPDAVLPPLVYPIEPDGPASRG